MSAYYPPYRSSSNNIKVELDLANYATKADLKNITHVDVSSFASKTNLAALLILPVDTIKMSLKKINFGNKEVDKKIYSSKETILLDSVDLSKIVVSSRCKIND